MSGTANQQTSLLLVAVQVDALALNDPSAVIGPDIDFSAMPWSDGLRDHNINTPNLAGYANSEPFEEATLLLEPGVHVHWSLPDGLTHGSTKAHPWSTNKINDLHFPAAPNRWLVRRIVGSEIQSWIVESDYVWPETVEALGEDRTERFAVTYPKRKHGPLEAPFLRIGRTVPLGDSYVAAEPGNYLPAHPCAGDVLTCVGYGNPAYAALYANCRSVFGLHDAAPPGDGPVEYEVIGWHAPPPDSTSPADPLAAFIADIATRDVDDLRARLNSARSASTDDDRLIAADQAMSPDERRKAIELLLGDTFGWRPDRGVDLPRRMVCYGSVTVVPGRSMPPVGDAGVDVIGLGHTGGEAMAALLADGLANELSESPEQIERRLEALRLQPLVRDHAVDLATRFDEVRHRAQYDTVTRQKVWSIRRKAQDGAASPPEPVDARAGPEALPEPVGRALHRLNAAQYRLDMARADLESLRMRLHCDWHSWMIARYRPASLGKTFEIDVNAMSGLLRRSVEQTAKRSADLYRDSGPEKTSLTAELERARSDLAAQLDAAHASNADFEGLHVVQAPGPRFLRPRDPVIALAHDLAQPSRRHGGDGVGDADGLATCLVVDDISTPDTLTRADDLNGFAQALRTEVEKRGFGVARSQQGLRGEWSPFRLEWEVELVPLARADELVALSLADDTVTSHFVLQGHEHDLRAAEAPPRSPNGTFLHGRTVLGGDMHAILRRAVDKHNASGSGNPEQEPQRTLRHAADLADLLNPRTVTLSGLTLALVGHRNELQYPIADPLGFPEDQALTAEVAALLGNFTAPSPRPDDAFMPLRNGWLRVSRIRLVDGFGQAVTLTPHRQAAAETFDSTVHTEASERWAPLAPRFAQPARLGAHWISALDDAVEANDIAATSPILGWLTVSHVDRGKIACHDADGLHLGAIDGNGRWSPAPGDGAVPDTPGAIDNPWLSAAMRWLTSRPGGEMFMQAFGRAIEDALATIDPPDLDDPESRALLTARPLALVRCRIGLEFLGTPAEGRRWKDIIARLSDAPPSTREIEHVRLPLRVGEQGRYGDGVVGYWIERDGGPLAGSPFDSTGFRCVKLAQDAPRGLVGADRDLTIAAADNALTLLLLFDPRADLHLSCGALPTRQLRIPPTLYRAQLGRIGFTHLAAPLLMPAGRLEVPLPEIGGGEWSWLTREGDGWKETGAQPRVSRAAVLKNWPDVGEALWDTLHQRGWLVADKHGAASRLRPPSDPAVISLPDGIGDAQQVLAVLERLADAIHRPLPEPRLDKRAELREGWIRLRRDPLTDAQEP